MKSALKFALVAMFIVTGVVGELRADGHNDAPAPRLTEKHYQDFLCRASDKDDRSLYNKEYRLADGARVDCYIVRGDQGGRVAVEIDFAENWAECVGQSILYAVRTFSQVAVCALIMRGSPTEIVNAYNRIRDVFVSINSKGDKGGKFVVICISEDLSVYDGKEGWKRFNCPETSDELIRG